MLCFAVLDLALWTVSYIYAFILHKPKLLAAQIIIALLPQ